MIAAPAFFVFWFCQSPMIGFCLAAEHEFNAFRKKQIALHGQRANPAARQDRR
jgi:hypothetical protein